jgi:antitoxin component YwqK of YwqJK toxin-antitoxin module
MVAVLFSCGTKQFGVTTPMEIAKQVPQKYACALDNNFYRQQDTIYYARERFSGLMYALYPVGDTEFVRSYFNGLEEGQQKKWYPNKQLAELRFYIGGKKQGLQQSWWPNGKQRFVYMAVNDVYDGELKEWTQEGLLYKDFHYVNGQEEGSEKMWWGNGTVRANYVTRNGKRYGLLGMKVCKNPYDSLVVDARPNQALGRGER